VLKWLTLHTSALNDTFKHSQLKLLFPSPCWFSEWNCVLCALVIKNSVFNSRVNEPFVSCGWHTRFAHASIFHTQLKRFILHTCCTIIILFFHWKITVQNPEFNPPKTRIFKVKIPNSKIRKVKILKPIF